jgi:hypothetical protein
MLVCLGIGSGVGCLGTTDEVVTGTLSVNLVGSTPSGAVYRLRDATVTVEGPTGAVFNTEDDPNRTSLSAGVAPGDYSASVAPGWRLERIDNGNAMTVNATLTSDNPVSFTVLPQQWTNVPLRFSVEGEAVEMTQGYDIVVDVDESIPSPGDGYQAIDAPSRRARLLYDSARAAIYTVNTLDQEIERFTFANGQWSTVDSLAVPQLTDAVMTPDGETLIVLQRDAINDISLATGPFAPVPRAVNPYPYYCNGSFDKSAAGSNGNVFVIFNSWCGGSSYIYNVDSHSLTGINSPSNGTVGASADGSRIYAGSNTGYGTVNIYNPETNTISGSAVSLYLSAITVSGDASRVILQNTFVYSRSLRLLGNVPAGGVVLASRDSSRAFVYRDDGPGPRLLVYDLNGPLRPGAIYPLVHVVQLPDLPNESRGTYDAISMTTNADDSVVFVSGNRKLLVVPVN